MNWPTRLRNLASDDPVLQRSQSLLASVEPHRDSEILQRRIYRTLTAPRPAAARKVFWRRALVVIALISFGTAAGATVSSRYATAWLAGREKPAPAATSQRLEFKMQPAVPSARAPAAPTLYPHVLPKVSYAPRHNRLPRRPPAATSSMAAAPSTTLGGHAALIVEATRALRIDRAPAHAMELLTKYFDADSDGALAEEAFGLALEASQSQSKRVRTKWALLYLKRFPHGRFTQQAERLLALP